MTAEEVGLKAPCILEFLPSKKIFQKLISRATQIKDVISELNPLEAKNDPRKLQNGEQEQVCLTTVNG
jgi:hypothetical protein